MSGGTVKVRIAVAVDAEGNWCASGTADGAWAMDDAAANVGDPSARFWLEAELPIPTTPTLPATVSEAP